MRLAVLELPARWGTPDAALDDVDARLAAGPPTELVLLPEAALHGYVSADGDFDAARFAEPLDGPTATRCAALARQHGTHLVASLVLAEGHAIYNAMIAFAPTGDVAFVYRKRHPWMPETWATPGANSHPIVTIAGRRVTIAVCYDYWFVGLEMNRELVAADVLLFPSAWVEAVDTRVARLQTLARCYGLTIANANWAPGVARVPGQGGSCIIAPAGDVIARAATAGRIDATVPPRA